MNTYLIQMVFRMENKLERVAQFDEQIRLIKAPDSAAAYEKAVYLAMEEEGDVQNINGSIIHWTFVGINRLLEISALSDKSEIFSGTRETFLPEAYEDRIKEQQQELILSINQMNNGPIPFFIR